MTASPQTMKRIQNLVWVCIYGGLLCIVLTLFLGDADAGTATTLRVFGGIAVAVGVVLILVRSRMTAGR
jgi:hypothetical protein